MSNKRLEKREKGEVITIRKGKWPNQLIAKAEITGQPTKTYAPVRITEVIKTDLFWWQYQVGRELDVTSDEVSQ